MPACTDSLGSTGLGGESMSADTFSTDSSRGESTTESLDTSAGADLLATVESAFDDPLVIADCCC